MLLHCLHADWDRAQPSLPFKSHKTINLTSKDHPIFVGSHEKTTVSSSLDFSTPTEALAFIEAPARPVSVSDSESAWSSFFLFSLYCSLVWWLFNQCAPRHVSPQEVASNGVNGGFQQEPVTMRNKGKEQNTQSERLWNWSWWLFLDWIQKCVSRRCQFVLVVLVVLFLQVPILTEFGCCVKGK